MSLVYPYYYSKEWLQYLKEYNSFYSSFLTKEEIWEDNDFFWLITLYYSKTKDQLEFRTGDVYIMTPYWKHKFTIMKKKDLEKWFQKLNQIYQSNQELSKQQLVIHQFPLETYFQRIPLLEMLDYSRSLIKLKKTIVRYRAWVELQLYSLEEIKSSFRKSYKSLINKFIREHNKEIVIYDSSSNFNNLELAQKFRDSHYKQAQKETKSQNGWLALVKMIQEGEAILIEYNQNFLYFLTHPDYSYYGISASDQNYQVGLMYKAIEYLKKNGYNLLDLGMTYLTRDYQSYFDSEKENSEKAFDIGFFKSGFATRITPDYFYQMDFEVK